MIELKYDVDQTVLLHAKVKEIHVGKGGEVAYRVQMKTKDETRFNNRIDIFADESQIVCGWIGDAECSK